MGFADYVGKALQSFDNARKQVAEWFETKGEDFVRVANNHPDDYLGSSYFVPAYKKFCNDPQFKNELRSLVAETVGRHNVMTRIGADKSVQVVMARPDGEVNCWVLDAAGKTHRNEQFGEMGSRYYCGKWNDIQRHQIHAEVLSSLSRLADQNPEQASRIHQAAALYRKDAHKVQARYLENVGHPQSKNEAQLSF